MTDREPGILGCIKDWHMEEYKLLSSHYFHEDNYFLRSMTIYSALNAALLAIKGADFVESDTFEIAVGIPFVGMAASILWSFSLIRLRHLRKKIEDRIAVIEKAYSISSDDPEKMLSIRNRKKSESIYTLPVSISMQAFPAVFFLIWVLTL